MSKISRRKFLGLSALAAAAVATPSGESHRLRVRTLKLSEQPTARFVHFSDFHFEGDAAFATTVVATINHLRPDFVCFTGDMVEDRKYAEEALGFIRQITAPVFGVPGNHDYWSHVSFDDFQRAFAATGGEWLTNRNAFLPQHDLELIGMDKTGVSHMSAAASRHVLMMHYPIMADRLGENCYDLILAGHSHGGQVRIPFVGPIVLPSAVGPYDRGHYVTRGGPLNVSAGVGMLSALPVRVNCPPEITLITI